MHHNLVFPMQHVHTRVCARVYTTNTHKAILLFFLYCPQTGSDDGNKLCQNVDRNDFKLWLVNDITLENLSY